MAKLISDGHVTGGDQAFKNPYASRKKRKKPRVVAKRELGTGKGPERL